MALDDTVSITRTGENPPKAWAVYRMDSSGEGYNKLGFIRLVVSRPPRWAVFRFAQGADCRIASFEGIGAKLKALNFLKDMSL